MLRNILLLSLSLCVAEAMVAPQTLTLFREFVTELREVVEDLQDDNCSGKCMNHCDWPQHMGGMSECVHQVLRDTSTLPMEANVHDRLQSLNEVWDCSRAHPCQNQGSTTDILACMQDKLNKCHGCVEANCDDHGGHTENGDTRLHID
uniref:Uncharacterized protein n=1 Tax=Ciona savignyi TaxID=51511 RepID=H2YGM1_CIOSA